MSDAPPRLDAAAAARVLAGGGVVAYPTEGVFGLGCDPANPAALQKLLAVKARDPRKGLILIAASLEQLGPWVAPLDPAQRAQLARSWPGPVTWVLPASPGAPAAVTGGRDTLAARVSAHPPVVELCRAFGGAIVSTSANLSGESPARHADQLGALSGLDACLDAAVGDLDGPTPIFDLRSGAQLRS